MIRPSPGGYGTQCTATQLHQVTDQYYAAWTAVAPLSRRDRRWRPMAVALGVTVLTVVVVGARLGMPRGLGPGATSLVGSTLDATPATATIAADAAGARAVSAEQSSASSSLRRPHILFIVPDDLGWNDVGYQSTDLKFATPTLDKLASEGVRLTQYATPPSCRAHRGGYSSQCKTPQS